MDAPKATMRFVFAHPVHLLAFGFGSGLTPLAPGTAGTLLAIPLYLGMQNLPDTVYLGLTGLMLIAGIRICGQTGSALNSKDPKGIVWDEIVGYLLTMMMAPPGWVWVISGFLIFRFFDIVKPWPVSWADRRLNGGLGIMMDDAIAGLYGCLVLQMTAAWY